MRVHPSRTWLVLAAGFAAAGCSRPAAQVAAAAETPVPAREPAADAPSYSGWYMVHGGLGSFRACGAASAWRIGAAGELPARAQAFGMDEDSPVYVRLHGATHGGVLDVTSVDQFGSPTPVRDCPMAGVVLPASMQP